MSARIFQKYLQSFYDNGQQKGVIVSVEALHPLIKNKNVFVFDFYTGCVEVRFLTSALPTKLVGSLFQTSRQVVGLARPDSVLRKDTDRSTTLLVLLAGTGRSRTRL